MTDDRGTRRISGAPITAAGGEEPEPNAEYGPAYVEETGRRLAANLPMADVLVHWDDPHAFLLAHVIARDKGMGRSSIVLDQGVILMFPEVAQGSKVIVLQSSEAGLTEAALKNYIQLIGCFLVEVVSL